MGYISQRGAEADVIVRKEINLDMVFLEDAKKKYLQETYVHGIRKGDRIRWTSHEYALILPFKRDSGTGKWQVGVLDREGKYISASSCSEQQLFSGYPCESFDRSDRKAVYCGSDRRHWGHFLVNVVPRLWVALEMDGLIEEYVIVRELHSGSLSLYENEIEFFRLLGILDKVRVIDTPTCYRSVIVPEPSYWHGKLTGGSGVGWGVYYKEFLDTYDYVAKKALAESEGLPDRKRWEEVEKVFFSCPQTAEHAGIEAVDSFFVNNGYHIVYAERISLTELICYLHRCGSVAYLSGTLQHNMLFAPGGRGAVALERRIRLPFYQTDIDLMKDISVTYVNVQYSISAEIDSYAPGMYAYTSELQEYSRKFRMEPPAYEYTTVGFLQKTLLCFLQNSVWKKAWIESEHSRVGCYYFDTISEDVSRIAEYFPEIGEINATEQADPEYWKHRWSGLLMHYNIPYSLWDEKDQRKLIRTFSSMIERNLEAGKREFLIFPYGANGMLFEDVLRRRYAISPKAVFDNNLSKYHPEIKKLDEIEDYMGDDTCIILTTLIPACRKALERYCDILAVESPFSVI